MQNLFDTCESADVQHGHRTGFFKGEIELLHHKVSEVISRHSKQLILIHRSGRIHQDHAIRSIRLGSKRTGRIGGRQTSVFTQTETQVPGHTGYIALHQGTATKDSLQHFTGQLRHIGCRIFLHQSLQCSLETFCITRLYVSQRIQEHKLRHQSCQRIFGTDIAEIPAYANRIACQITIISRFVDRILHGIHPAYIIFIIRIGNGNRIILVRESIDHLCLVFRSQSRVPRAESHQIHLIIAVQAM